MAWDVVELDLSFQMRIVSPSDSPGLRFSGGVLDFGVQAMQTRPGAHGDPPGMVRFLVQESTLNVLALLRRFRAKLYSRSFFG